ncbi:TPA: Eaa protein [Escherichia coli]|nr:Eaa protein [Escherichia coli]
MTTITKERIELFIKNPLENGLTRGEQMELARIALASLEADPVKRVNSDQMRRVCLEANRHLDKYDAMAKEVNKLLGRIAPPAPVVPEEATPENVEMLSGYVSTYKLTDSERDIAAEIWNACRTAMLQSGNFRESKNSSTNNFREIAETSTNYPVIPSEVLSAILKVAKIRADFDDFDGDRRGIGDCLDEAEQELIVTINKYASQLAAEPIAPNDVREQTAIPQVPVTPDGWISCSEKPCDYEQYSDIQSG